MKKQIIAALIATMLLTSCAAQGTQTASAQTAEQATPHRHAGACLRRPAV